METLLQDIRFGLRTLLRTPGFTLIAVIALALGIGANTAIFSVVNTVILRPLGYARPERLVKVMALNTKDAQAPTNISYPNFVDWKAQNHVFTDMATYYQNSCNLTGAGDPQQLKAQNITANLFSVVGVKPILGRSFTEDEEKPNGPSVAILSNSLWLRRFGGDASIVGKSITIDGKSTTVVGILPAGFNLVPETDIWLPLGLPLDERMRLSLFLDGIARLKDDVSLGQAKAGMSTIADGLAKQYPRTNTNWTVTVTPLMDDVVGQVRTKLFVLLGAVGFVLLIACANVANLLLAKASARQKEISIRMAVGASRSRIIRQLLTESVILSVCGGLLGLLLASWGISSLVSLSKNLPRVSEIGIDFRVLGFTFGISLLTGLVFGLVPAIQSSKVDLNEALKDGSKGSSGAAHNRLRNILVISEIALALMLLFGAGLLIRSFRQLVNVDPGFNEEHILTFDMTLPQTKYATPDQASMFFQQTLANLRRIPGVESVAANTTIPLGGGFQVSLFYIEGRPARGPEDYTATSVDTISPDYLKTMGIKLLRGRDITEQDRKEVEHVVLISESMAKKFFPNEDPLGKHLKMGGGPQSQNPWMTVVGVINDVKQFGLESKKGESTMYIPYLQAPDNYSAFLMRARGKPESLVSAVRSVVQAIDKDQPIANVKTMDQILSEYVSQNRFYMLLLTIFSGIALLLASIGIYGVMSYSVTQRTHEIGIRMALGAKPMDILKSITGQGMLLAGIGIVVGASGAFLLKSLVSTMLFNVSTTDPATFVAIAAIIVAVCFFATYIPARRGMKVDPMTAMRSE